MGSIMRTVAKPVGLGVKTRKPRLKKTTTTTKRGKGTKLFRVPQGNAYSTGLGNFSRVFLSESGPGQRVTSLLTRPGKTRPGSPTSSRH